MAQVDGDLSSESAKPIWSHPGTIATLCGILSAIGYTATNICLKHVDHADPIWVSCMKALPTVVLAGPFVLAKAMRGKKLFPSNRVFAIVIAVAIFSQFGGNVLFQWALHVIGLALDVPITLGVMIVSGALFGRMFLGDPISPRMAISAIVLIAATCVLSAGASKVHDDAVHASAELENVAAPGSDAIPISNWGFLLGVFAAATSGVAYCSLSTVVRYATREGFDNLSLVGLICLVGVVTLGASAFSRHGLEIVFHTTTRDYTAMLLAGVFNYIAFVSLAKALEFATVFFVNALSTCQVVMAAVAGIVLFGEPATVELLIGIALIGIGLLSMRPASRKGRTT
ncbi:MAG: DMT family transporter [Planctomycetales bacterium]|nr:DMT family transporter [Planctomycetales bacterium]